MLGDHCRRKSSVALLRVESSRFNCRRERPSIESRNPAPPSRYPSVHGSESRLADGHGNAHTANTESEYAPKTVSTGQGIISSLISQIMAGEKPSDVCVEGMPVNAIRKLVARQMSMATQLLVQILLQADERSDCFTRGYTCFMELSNMRQKALRKAALVQMNVNNATAIQNLRSNGAKGAHLQQPQVQVESVLAIERRYTRSAITQSVDRCHSVFDVPALPHIDLLFDMIDKSRRAIKETSFHPKTKSTVFEGEDGNGDGEKHAVVTGEDGGRDESFGRRSFILEESKRQLSQIMQRVNMRLWHCLIPLPSYPMNESLISKIDPTSLSGRSFFTPSEDDLLLRGIIAIGENDWSEIRKQFLPSKECQSLQFRLTQMTSLTAPDSNIFKA